MQGLWDSEKGHHKKAQVLWVSYLAAQIICWALPSNFTGNYKENLLQLSSQQLRQALLIMHLSDLLALLIPCYQICTRHMHTTTHCILKKFPWHTASSEERNGISSVQKDAMIMSLLQGGSREATDICDAGQQHSEDASCERGRKARLSKHGIPPKTQV